MRRDDLVRYLDEYLNIAAIKDFGPQGLQVEGREEVRTIAGMVDAQLPCVEAALTQGADLMLVHHGIFWGETRLLNGAHGRLVRTLIESDLNLYAAHLALDAHAEVGNNAMLARTLDLEIVDQWAKVNGVNLGVIAASTEGVSFESLVGVYERRVGAASLVQPFGPPVSRRVAILSGGGAADIYAAAALGCDTVLTGETSHAHYYDAQQCGLNLIYGGHYFSETVGVRELGQRLAERFDLTFRFIDMPTGI